MTKSKNINLFISRQFFLGVKKEKNGVEIISESLVNKASVIISTCQDALLLVRDSYIQELLGKIIRDTSKLLQLINMQKNRKTKEAADEILQLSQQLQVNTFMLPPNLEPQKALTSTSYNVAVTCLYLLAFSFSIAVGAAFYAWYFNFLVTDFFLTELVVALSTIGIPASCLGTFAFGIYSSEVNNLKKTNSLNEKVADFCDEITVEEGVNDEDKQGVCWLPKI